MRARLLARLTRLEATREGPKALIFVLADDQPDSALSGFEMSGQTISRRPQESIEAFMARVKGNTVGGLAIAVGVYK